MKRITTILIGLALVISVNAQFQNSGGMFLRTGSSFTTAPASSNQSTNMLANGTFDSGDYWSTSNTWSIGSGVATCATSASPSALFQIGTDMITDLEPSTNYTISFDIVSSSPGIWFRILNGSGTVTFVEGTYYTTGHYSLDFTTASDLTIGGIRFYTYTDQANPGTIDNVTLVER